MDVHSITCFIAGSPSDKVFLLPKDSSNFAPPLSSSIFQAQFSSICWPLMLKKPPKVAKKSPFFSRLVQM
ncbi:hypothetical protein V6N12_011795 [Hibiscus sabdariffa]|uniref:Uncharacterized protein n=1 Tax=Hibiscus sabdariffa TaxID=183260 RepID=A0ABR2BUX7_9ROSI